MGTLFHRRSRLRGMRTKTRAKAGAIYNNHNAAKVLVTPSVNPWLPTPRKVVVVMADVGNPWRR